MKALILTMTFLASMSAFAGEVESKCTQINNSEDRSEQEISSTESSSSETRKNESSNL